MATPKKPLPPNYTPERQCKNCGQMFTRNTYERVGRFMARNFCSHACGTSPIARKGLAHLHKRPVMELYWP